MFRASIPSFADHVKSFIAELITRSEAVNALRETFNGKEHGDKTLSAAIEFLGVNLQSNI